MAIGNGTGVSVMRLEHPPFGQFVRRVAGLTTEQVQVGLEHQTRDGGRLGAILRSQGLLTREQLIQVLSSQARWIATILQADVAPHGLPYPAFFSLCLPAYNEESNIEDTLDAACAILPEFVARFEVVVVNDGSQDRTAEIVRAYAEKEPRVRLVEHAQNAGYGAAVTSGLQAAQGDLIAFSDADGQFSFLDLPQLLAELDGCDVVLGYRYPRADPWIRRLNAWAWNRLIRFALGVRVRDLDCAFKVFRRKVLDQLHMSSNGAAINAELLAQCVRNGHQMRETPVKHFPRYSGAPTGAALKVISRAFRELPGLLHYRWGKAAVPVNRGLAESLPTPTTA